MREGARGWGLCSDAKRKYDTKLVARSKRLRNDPTPAEDVLWQHLRRSQLQGHKFRRQQPIGPFIVDFYCASLKLAIELDGSSHEGKEGYDGFRESGIEGRGVRVIRFLNSEVMEDIDGALAEIARRMPPAPTLPLEGEGV